MANVNHSSLSDPYLHEPKGASTALPGQIYVADGAGSGNWVENSRAIGAYLSYSTSSPYAHTTTTSFTAMNPSFSVAVNNGFTPLSSPNARVRYDGAETIAAALDVNFSIQQASGSNKDIEIAIYKNGTEIAGSRMIATAASGVWSVISLIANTNLSTNDYLEVFVKSSAAATINFASGYLRATGIAV